MATFLDDPSCSGKDLEGGSRKVSRLIADRSRTGSYPVQLLFYCRTYMFGSFCYCESSLFHFAFGAVLDFYQSDLMRERFENPYLP